MNVLAAYVELEHEIIVKWSCPNVYSLPLIYNTS